MYQHVLKFKIVKVQLGLIVVLNVNQDIHMVIVKVFNMMNVFHIL